jgi:hypothetical protein
MYEIKAKTTQRADDELKKARMLENNLMMAKIITVILVVIEIGIIIWLFILDSRSITDVVYRVHVRGFS